MTQKRYTPYFISSTEQITFGLRSEPWSYPRRMTVNPTYHFELQDLAASSFGIQMVMYPSISVMSPASSFSPLGFLTHPPPHFHPFSYLLPPPSSSSTRIHIHTFLGSKICH